MIKVRLTDKGKLVAVEPDNGDISLLKTADDRVIEILYIFPDKTKQRVVSISYTVSNMLCFIFSGPARHKVDLIIET